MILLVLSNVAATVAKAAEAASYSPLNTVLNVIGIGLLSLVLNHMRLSRKLAVQESESDRAGWGQLITTLQGQVDRQEKQIKEQNQRIELLEQDKQRDHRLIIELMGQVNRGQAAAIMAGSDVSPQLRRALDATLEGKA